MVGMRRLKMLLRSGSPNFTSDYFDAAKGIGAFAEIHELLWRERPIYYRTGTSDVGLVYDILLKHGSSGEYWLPQCVQPSVILDIGGNIGIASRYLADRFPKATIFSFEPIAENYELLKMNSRGFDNIRTFPFGLASTTGQFEFNLSARHANNMGAYSRYAKVKEGEGVTKLAELRSAAEVFAEFGIQSVDLIKIDTEGDEYDILAAIPTDVIQSVRWIYGELHAADRDQPTDFKTLDYLSRWFNIEVSKPLHKRNYSFDACNRAIKDEFKNFARR